jgi:hypothetical protein
VEHTRRESMRELQRSRIDAGICPNGCGLLTVISKSTSDCPQCKFAHVKSTIVVRPPEAE